MINKTNGNLLEASNNQDGRKIQSLAKELAKLETVNESVFEDLEIQMDLFEKIEILFDNQLEEFER